MDESLGRYPPTKPEYHLLHTIDHKTGKVSSPSLSVR
jgi:hypothetical protein